MNNDQEIILAKISAVYDKPPFVKMETGQMEMILKCVGLGAYYDKYREYLEPYWYNGRFQNPVESYRIFVGLNISKKRKFRMLSFWALKPARNWKRSSKVHDSH